MPWGALLSVGAAALSAAGSMAAGDKAAKGADSAAQTQWNMYQQNRADLAPYREVGTSALNAYARAMGLPTADSGARSSNPANAYQYPTSGKVNDYAVVQAFQEFKGRRPTKRELDYYTDRERGDQLYYDVVQPGMRRLEAEKPAPAPEPEDQYGGFTTSPGYEFRFDEGQRAVDRNAAARGRYLSGAREKAATRYGQDYASNEFGNYMNRLAGAAGIGQTATNVGVGAGNYAAGNIGNAQMAGGNARASGYMGVTNTLTNAYNNYMALNPFEQNNPNAPGGSAWNRGAAQGPAPWGRR